MRIQRKLRITFLAAQILLLAFWSLGSAFAIEADEVRNYEDVFVISGLAPDRSKVEVSWDIAEGYYLYNNRFLKFDVETTGVVLGDPQIPRGKIEFDDLLGEEVEKYQGQITVTIPLVSVNPKLGGFRLSVRSQGCLENVLCYPPTQQVLLIGLPLSEPESAKSAAPPDSPTERLFEPAIRTEVQSGADLIASGLSAGKADTPLSGQGLASAQDQALEAEAAFIYEAIGLSTETVLVRFTAQPGYYLYRDKFEFRVVDDSGFSVREVSLPDGVIKDDPEFGNVPVIFGQVEIPVRLNRPAGPVSNISLQADFQGCRDGDICYPPQSRTVSFEMPASTVAIGQAETGKETQSTQKAGIRPPVSEQDRLATLLTENPVKAIFAFFIAGLLLAFTPCVFPMVPILSGIIMGEGDRLTPMRAFWLSLVYVLAMAVTYTVAGVLAGLFGQNLQAIFQNPWILSGFVFIFILLALSMFGFYELQLPASLQTRLANASNQQKGGQLWGVAIMGLLSALIVGPCVAPPLMAALIVIGASGDATLGGFALFSLSMGMGVPLILFGVSAGKLAPRAGPWMDAVKAVFGVGLLAIAIWLLERILSGTVIMLLWGGLAVASGVYLGALERIPDGASGWKRLWKSIGVILLMLGALEIIGAASGGHNWLKPLDGLVSGTGSATVTEEVHFQSVKSIEDLDRSITLAGQQGKPAMLDFYADWCVECIRMERNTFRESSVQSLLNQMSPLQADVTEHDEIDQALMKKFGIIGPPAILFFDRNGQEMRAWRLVGYFSPDEFAEHLSGVLAAQP